MVIFLCPVLGSCLWATLAIVGGMIMSACCFLMLLCACRCYVLGKCATRTCCCRPGPHRNVPKRHPKRGFFGQSKFAAKHPAAEPTDPQIGEEGACVFLSGLEGCSARSWRAAGRGVGSEQDLRGMWVCVMPARDVSGLCMGSVWDVYGMCMGCVWDVYGMCMGCVWDVYGMCMGCVWDVYGMWMGCVWDVCEMCV